MASQFIGLHMRVILKDPPGYCLSGIVRDVEAGYSLTLTNGIRALYGVLFRVSLSLMPSPYPQSTIPPLGSERAR